MDSHVTKYYINQAGNGISNYFSGSNFQRGYGSLKGHGLGGFLGGLFRTILPFLKSGAAAVGREALRTGSHILADAASGEVPLAASVQNHTKEATSNLMQKLNAKLSGTGIKRKRRARKAQSKRGPPRAKKRKENTVVRDIFHL